MESLLAPHLQQVSAASASIYALPFTPPKIFSNALLKSTDIVSLIRDTDAHERALFTEPPSQRHASEASSTIAPDKSRVSIAPRRNTAVYSVLGGDMVAQLRRGGAGGVGSGVGGVATGDVDVELLLLGAEKLISVYNIPGAADRIGAARERYEQLTESIINYEALVEAQRSQLELLHHRAEDDQEVSASPMESQPEIPDAMFEEEEQKIKELELRKEEMELKIKSIDRKMGHAFRT